MVTLDDLYVLAAQNACNSVKQGGLTETLLGYCSFLWNQPDSMIHRDTTEIHRAKHVPLKNGCSCNSGHFVVWALGQRTIQLLPPKPLRWWGGTFVVMPQWAEPRRSVRVCVCVCVCRCVCPEPNLENHWKLSAGSCNASKTRHLMTIKYARFSI